jgi:DNA-binding GntR family transcriptional regulator
MTSDADLGMAERIAHVLREQIITGELAMGARLSEREIAERLSVSRAPVREALPILEAEGFVSSSRRRAAVVHTFTLTDASELFDLRAQLEPLAARLAAVRASEGADLSGIRQSLDVAHAPVADASPSARNSDLHEEIIKLAGHSLLERMSGLLSGRVRWLFRLTPERDTSSMWDEHREMVDAIAAGSADLAALLASAHVERGRIESMPLLAERLPAAPPRARRRRKAAA